MNNINFSTEEPLPPAPPEVTDDAPALQHPTDEEILAEAAAQQHLSDDEIVRLVDREMGIPTDSESNSRSQLIAFGVTLVAFLYVGILLLARFQPTEAARAATSPGFMASAEAATIPRWINWTYSFEEGQNRARRNHTKVLIDFYTDWCPSCKWVDSAVYTRPDVLTEAQNVSMVKINAEGRPDLAKRYNIHVYPSFVWTDENGNVTARHDGSTSASEFAPLMAQNR